MVCIIFFLGESFRRIILYFSQRFPICVTRITSGLLVESLICMLSGITANISFDFQIKVSKGLNLEARAVLTRMSSPIGYTVGNALEIEESILCLRGQGPPQLDQLVEEMGKWLHQFPMEQTQWSLKLSHVARGWCPAEWPSGQLRAAAFFRPYSKSVMISGWLTIWSMVIRVLLALYDPTQAG